MAVDTPARIAVLGAGPIGLETALYARFLGYEVEVFERGQVGEHVRDWSHVRMFTPFHMNCSPLGLAAIEAQDTTYGVAEKDALLTGGEWLERYLLPLSRTDLLADHIHERTTVMHVGRTQLLKNDLPMDETRREAGFRILVQEGGHERAVTADVVIDTTGVYSNPNWLGAGGTPAVGERELRDQIHYALPMILGEQYDRFAGRRTLLLGSGYTAATNAVALGTLVEEAPGTRVTWITRRPPDTPPIRTIEDDRLPERATLAQRANALASQGGDAFSYHAATHVAQVRCEEDCFHVELVGAFNDTLAVDEIIANVGFRPDLTLARELQIHQCYASEGPMKLAASLLKQTSADCLDQTSSGPETLMNPEPNFYILGAKSYGRNSNFLFSVGMEQIRDLFSMIGDRAGLDLYSGMKSLT